MSHVAVPSAWGLGCPPSSFITKFKESREKNIFARLSGANMSMTNFDSCNKKMHFSFLLDN